MYHSGVLPLSLRCLGFSQSKMVVNRDFASAELLEYLAGSHGLLGRSRVWKDKDVREYLYMFRDGR